MINLISIYNNIYLS